MTATDILSRYDAMAIVLTHTFTIGFFTHIMFGSMFQMLPVMLGLAYKNVLRNAIIIYLLLNIGLILFVLGFYMLLIPLLYIAASFLLVAFLLFGFLSLKTLWPSETKDYFVNTFATSFSMLIIAIFFGFGAVLSWSGITDRVIFGESHIFFILFGWVFLLINAVSFKIIPMFFVAKEFPEFIKNNNYKITITLLLSFIFLQLLEKPHYIKIIEICMIFVATVFALYSIKILKNRKRARKDISVTLWYFAMTNMLLALFLYLYRIFFMNESIDFLIGFFALFGGLYALINAMLYKIVPFLTWFHLSSNMVFEAEMNSVISKQNMKIQTYFYYSSYALVLLSLFWSVLLKVAALIFLLSSIFLLKNILGAYKYYRVYIKKAISV
jgi:hypothetical protein